MSSHTNKRKMYHISIDFVVGYFAPNAAFNRILTILVTANVLMSGFSWRFFAPIPHIAWTTSKYQYLDLRGWLIGDEAIHVYGARSREQIWNVSIFLKMYSADGQEINQSENVGVIIERVRGVVQKVLFYWLKNKSIWCWWLWTFFRNEEPKRKKEKTVSKPPSVV